MTAPSLNVKLWVPSTTMHASHMRDLTRSLYTQTHPDRQTDRHTDRHTQRQTHIAAVIMHQHVVRHFNHSQAAVCLPVVHAVCLPVVHPVVHAVLIYGNWIPTSPVVCCCITFKTQLHKLLHRNCWTNLQCIAVVSKQEIRVISLTVFFMLLHDVIMTSRL